MCGCEAHWNLNAICSCDCRSHDQFVKDGPASSRFNQRLAVTAPALSPAEERVERAAEALFVARGYSRQFWTSGGTPQTEGVRRDCRYLMSRVFDEIGSDR